MLIDIYNKEGKVTGQLDLSDDIFAIEPNEDAMHKSVVVYLAHQRQGTHKTKGKAEVSGGGKKPWRQKGRGTARSGSSRSPLWVGGGTVHGPQPHKYSIDLQKKVKRLAKISALSLRASEKNIVVLEDFQVEEIKTKTMADVLKNLNINGMKTLILLPEIDKNMYLSARNIPNVSIYPFDKISTYDILCHKKLLMFKGTVDKLVEAFNN
jgi:large subunit ribosomal protein L4